MTVFCKQPLLPSEEDGEYAAFVDKFRTKKTTDDCYTPDNVYAVVLEWASRRYGFDPSVAVRPFWPGGDFERFDYPDGCVVVDNPPFSMMSKILKFYAAHRVRFFLFSHAMTLFRDITGVNYVVAGVNIQFSNGAELPISFATSEGEYLVEAAPDLRDALDRANETNVKAGKRKVTKLRLPDACLTAMGAAYLASHHTPYRLRREDAIYIAGLDNYGKGIFGGGFLLSERAAAERAAATVVELSEREREMQRRLGEQA